MDKPKIMGSTKNESETAHEKLAKTKIILKIYKTDRIVSDISRNYKAYNSVLKDVRVQKRSAYL